MDLIETTAESPILPSARPMLSINSMLTPVRLPDPSAFLEARPLIERLIESHVVPLRFRGADELRSWLYNRSEDTPQHMLMMSEGEPLGLIPRWSRKSDPGQLVIGLGKMDGPLVIGRNRTLALLGFVRSLQTESTRWDVVLAPGSSIVGDLRRLETAARCERLSNRLVNVDGSSVLIIPSPSGLRTRVTVSASSDASLVKRYDLASMVNHVNLDRSVTESAIPILRVVFDPDSNAHSSDMATAETELSSAGSQSPRRPPSTRPPLRVVRPS